MNTEPRLPGLGVRCFGLALVAAAMLPGPAEAQTAAGFALDRYEPAERGSDWFSLDSLDLRGGTRPAAGVALDWGKKPLVIYDRKNNARGTLVGDQVFLHVGGAVILGDRLRLGASLPIALYQGGKGGTINGALYKPPTGAAAGDLRIGIDARLVGKYGDPFTLALGAQVYMPTGSKADYTSDGTLRFAPHLLAAGDVGILAYAARMGFHYRTEYKVKSGPPVGSELFGGIAAGVRLVDRKLLLGPELLWNYSLRTAKDLAGTYDTPAELTFGGHYTIKDDFRVGLGMGPGLTRAPGSPTFRFLATFEWFPAMPPPDTDGDGVLDVDDACPMVPGIRTGDPRTHGCPPPPDTDGDGIIDGEDACPKDKGPRSADPKTNGCPPPPDRDGDGVLDVEDACPGVPGVRTEDPKTNGCPPPPPPPDRDKDTVSDPDDACPDVPGVKTADAKTNGCPPDRDLDGVSDAEDACPDQPGLKDPDPKKNGCPLARVEDQQVKIREQVKFQIGSAKILPESEAIISAVADVMKAHPEWKRLRIEGHTDSMGGEIYNLGLSASRATAVLKALTGKGIDRKLLKAKGLGRARPIADNATPEGRQDNRRVEFHIDEK